MKKLLDWKLEGFKQDGARDSSSIPKSGLKLGTSINLPNTSVAFLGVSNLGESSSTLLLESESGDGRKNLFGKLACFSGRLESLRSKQNLSGKLPCWTSELGKNGLFRNGFVAGFTPGYSISSTFDKSIGLFKWIFPLYSILGVYLR